MAAYSLRTRGMPAGFGVSILVGLTLALLWGRRVSELADFVALLIWLGVFLALILVTLCAAIRKQLPVAFAALILALIAFGLGQWNSENVSEIEPDRRAEKETFRKRQIKARDDNVQKL